MLKSFDNLGREKTTVDEVGTEDIAAGAAGLGRGSFSVYRAAALSLVTTSVVIFDSEAWDLSNWYDTATGRFTPQLPGIYRLTAMAHPLTTGAENNQGYLRKNGAPAMMLWASYSTPAEYGHGTVLVSANGTTDYFDIRVDHNHGSALAFAVGVGECFFQGALVTRL